MGAVNFGGGNKTYYQITQGKLTVYIDKSKYEDLKSSSDVKVRHRVTSKGNDKYEIIYDAITGVIVGYEPAMNERLKQMEVKLTLQDGEAQHVIQFPYDSRIHTMLMQRMPNIDTSREILFGVFEGDKPDGSKVTMMYMKYVGEKDTIKNAFPKDGDHKLPPLKQIKKAGQPAGWDSSAQQEFFEEQVIPPFKERIGQSVPAPKPEPKQPQPVMADAEDDDLFFKI
jgi:hypothetical protein